MAQTAPIAAPTFGVDMASRLPMAVTPPISSQQTAAMLHALAQANAALTSLELQVFTNAAPIATVELGQIVQEKIERLHIHFSNLRSEKYRHYTLRRLYNDYIELHAKQSNRSWQKSAWYFDRYIGATELADKSALEVTKEDVARLRSHFAESIGRTTANRVVEMLSAAYSRCTALGVYFGPNPASGFQKFRTTERVVALTPEQFARFEQEVLSRGASVAVCAVLLMLYTGQRRSCVQAMKWADIDLTEGVWTMPADTQKNGRAHALLLVPAAADFLRALYAHRQDDSPWVFPGAGADGHLTRPDKTFRDILKNRGITNFRMHDLRHTLASWLARTGANLVQIGKILNHKDIKSTMRYSHLDYSDTQAPVQQALARLGAAANHDMVQHLGAAVPMIRKTGVTMDYNTITPASQKAFIEIIKPAFQHNEVISTDEIRELAGLNKSTATLWLRRYVEAGWLTVAGKIQTGMLMYALGDNADKSVAAECSLTTDKGKARQVAQMKRSRRKRYDASISAEARRAWDERIRPALTPNQVVSRKHVQELTGVGASTASIWLKCFCVAGMLKAADRLSDGTLTFMLPPSEQLQKRGNCD